MIIRDLQLIQEEPQRAPEVRLELPVHRVAVQQEFTVEILRVERQKLSILDREPVREIAKIRLEQHLEAVHETLILLLPVPQKGDLLIRPVVQIIVLTALAVPIPVVHAARVEVPAEAIQVVDRAEAVVEGDKQNKRYL